MSTRKLPNIAYLRQRLRYDPESGNLFWCECTTMPANWNARHAGKRAGTVRRGYIAICLDKAFYRAHHLVWAMVHGYWPSNQIDHIDHDRANNRIENLRLTTARQNSQNRRLPADNITGAFGVYKDRRPNKWVASITIQRRTKHLGYFNNLEDAVAARKKAELAYGFHPNHGARFND